MKTPWPFSLFLLIENTWDHDRAVMAFQHANVVPGRSYGFTQTRLKASHDDVESTTTISPWSPGKWRITLHFQREDESNNESSGENTAARLNKFLGEDWGANSAQLVLSFDICVTADASPEKFAGDNKPSISSAWLGGRPTGTIECIPQLTTDEPYHATYVNDRGQQYVKLSSGPWRIEPPLPLVTSTTTTNGKPIPGQASTLRFALTIQNPIQRNSIRFGENQLLLLQCNTFREEQYESGVDTLLPFVRAKDNAQKMLDEQLDHESGDRRLDGTELLPLLEGYKDVAGLVWERDERYRKWKEIEAVLPLLVGCSDGGYNVERILEDDSRWGVWPGDIDLLTIERGVILASVERKESKRGALSWMNGNQARSSDTVIVGRWSAKPIWDEDD